MKRIISLVFVTLMLVNIAVSGVSAVRYMMMTSALCAKIGGFTEDSSLRLIRDI